MRRVFVDREAPQRDAIEEAATWIRRGGVIAIPTDTFYGLGADPFNASAIDRVFHVKGRTAERALPLIAADLDQIQTHLGAMPRLGAQLAERFWPGPLTLLIPAPVSLAPGVTGDTGRVGVRVPDDSIVRAVCSGAGRPITATSANISGEPATTDPAIVERTLGSSVDYLLDTGTTPGGAASTIVDVTGAGPQLVRAGAVLWDDIQAWLQRA